MIIYTVLQYQPSQFTVDGKTKSTTTDLVSTYTNKFGNTGTAVSEYTYTYDTWGSITKIKDLAGRQRTYTYNEYGEITNASETYSDGTTTAYAYTYDNGGNILTETIGNVTHSYKYDSVWKDKLISYDGKAITYDVFGCPINYMGKSMKWDKSGSLTDVGNSIHYTYLLDGQRHTKTVNGKTTTYNYNNGMLLSETSGDETLRYYYDALGRVISVTYKKGTGAETIYFYTRNLQGDITAVYRASDSKLIGTYEYDLWGRPINVKEASTGIDTQGILTKNPFRYRGYYYDTETGFYNLNARYYDPQVRRFISADSMSLLMINTASVNCKNLFAYCENDPVNSKDSNGTIIETIFDVVTLGISIVDVFMHPKDPWAWACLAGDAVDLIPFVTCVGEGVKGLRIAKMAGKVDDVGDGLKLLSKADDVADSVRLISKTDDVVDAGKMIKKVDLAVDGTRTIRADAQSSSVDFFRHAHFKKMI